MHVRDARPNDWQRVKDLLAELGRPDVRDDPGEPQHRDAFERYLARDDTLALLADDGGEVVGFVDVEFRQRLNFLEPQAWVPDLVVAESARGKGVGRLLLEEAERRARERGCWGMTLESANWRDETHAFYERVGWKSTGKSFTRPISDVQWPPAPR